MDRCSASCTSPTQPRRRARPSSSAIRSPRRSSGRIVRYVSMARRLAGRGHPVLRFDFRGNGDSDGAFAEFSLTGALGDVARAADLVRARTGRDRVVAARPAPGRDHRRAERGSPRRRRSAGAVGARRRRQPLHAGAAAGQPGDAARGLQGSRGRIAPRWSPRCGAAPPSTSTATSWAARCTTRSPASSWRPTPAPFGGRCLVVQVDRQEAARPLPELQQLQGRYAGGELVLVREEPFWKEIDAFYASAPRAVHATLAWLEAAA